MRKITFQARHDEHPSPRYRHPTGTSRLEHLGQFYFKLWTIQKVHLLVNNAWIKQTVLRIFLQQRGIFKKEDWRKPPKLRSIHPEDQLRLMGESNTSSSPSRPRSASAALGSATNQGILVNKGHTHQRAAMSPGLSSTADSSRRYQSERRLVR